MSTDNKVTIYINPEGVGHAFVILNDGVNDTVAGFYPEKKGMPLWTGKVVGKEEIEDSFYQYSYDISKEQYNKISKYIGDIKTTPSLYSIFASPDGDRILQCTSFVKEIIKIGDIPHEYMDNPMPHSLISELYRLIKEPDENKRAIWEKESNKTQGLSEIYNNQTFNIQTLASKLLKPYTIIKTQHNKIKSIKIFVLTIIR